MNRTYWLAAGLCVGGAVGLIWGGMWFADRLNPPLNPGALAYRPADDVPPPVDLASIQRDWPDSLGDAGDRSRLISYHKEMAGKAPVSQAGSAKAATPEPDMAVLLATANPEAGKAKAQLCVSCHDFTQGGPNRIGPNLWGVVGRVVGTHAGFAYSPAMKGHGGNWTYESLYAFLASPARDVPGTKMSFAGLRRPEDRAAVIRYLATLGTGAPPLPQPE